MHCHIEVHADIGQMMVLQVGDIRHMPKVPRNFPKCGDYLPPIGSDHWSHDEDSESHDHDTWSLESFEDDLELDVDPSNGLKKKNVKDDDSAAPKVENISEPRFIKHFKDFRKKPRKVSRK